MPASFARPLAVMLAVLAGALLLPALLAHGRGQAGIYLSCAFAAAFAGAAAALAGGQTRRAGRPGDALFLVLAWLVLPVVAAPPIMLSGASFSEAYLDALSAFTVTGGPVLDPMREVPDSVHLWRALLQAGGGLLSIVFAAAVLATVAAGLPAGLARAGAPALGTALGAAARRLAPAYAGLVTLCCVLLLVAGVPPLDAFCLAAGAVSTGGLAGPQPAAAHGPAAMLILVPFMAAGAASLPWLMLLSRASVRAGRGRTETLALAAVVAVPGLALAAVLLRGGMPAGSSVAEGLFAAASLATTTGLPPSAATVAAVPQVWLFVAVLVGGGGVSAAGGIRLYRFGLFAEALRHELVRLVYPHVVLPLRAESTAADTSRRAAITAVLALTMLLTGALTAVIAAVHPSFEGALALAVSGLTNTGPLYLGWMSGPGWPAVGALDAPAQVAYALAMLAGRLDILALALVIDPRLWRG